MTVLASRSGPRRVDGAPFRWYSGPVSITIKSPYRIGTFNLWAAACSCGAEVYGQTLDDAKRQARTSGWSYRYCPMCEPDSGLVGSFGKYSDQAVHDG